MYRRLAVAGRTEEFQKHHLSLIPPDETFRGAAGAAPRGAFAAFGGAAAGTPGPSAKMELHGEASKWPTRFPRDRKAPERWRWSMRDFFWLVMTDKQLHVFQGRTRWRGPAQAGPEAAHYPLDRIAAMRLDKGFATLAALTISFKDGSSVELDLANRKIDPFLEAIRPFTSRASTQS